jgi:hypothetical protein
MSDAPDFTALLQAQQTAYDEAVRLFNKYVTDRRWIVGQWETSDGSQPYRVLQFSEDQQINLNLKTNMVKWFAQTGSHWQHNGIQTVLVWQAADYQLTPVYYTKKGLERALKLPPKGKRAIPIPYTLSSLSADERRWHYQLPPPREQLQMLCRYDEKADLLILLNEQGHAEYESAALLPPARFILLEGKMVPRWRIISMLRFGNPQGVAVSEAEYAALHAVPMTGEPIAQSRDAAIQEIEQMGDMRGANYREKSGNWWTKTETQRAADKQTKKGIRIRRRNGRIAQQLEETARLLENERKE